MPATIESAQKRRVNVRGVVVSSALALLTACGDDISQSALDGSRDAVHETAVSHPSTDSGADARMTFDAIDFGDAESQPQDDAMPADDAFTSATDARDAGRDAGATDVVLSDAFFGASRCASAGVAFCDDFELGHVDTTRWTSHLTTGSTVAVDSTRAARGRFSLHVRTNNEAGATAMLRETTGFPFASNTFYGRVFVYVEAHTPQYNFNAVEAGGTSTNGARYLLGGQANPWGTVDAARFRFNYQPTDTPSRSTTPVPRDRWMCWEWEFRGSSNELHFWLDGTELADMAVTGAESAAWPAPNFGYLAIGLHHAHPDVTPEFNVWLDEVAIDSARIGCTR